MKDEEFTVKCYEVPAGIDPQKTPWLYKYIQLHGGDVMSVKWGPSLGKYKSAHREMPALEPVRSCSCSVCSWA